MNYNYGNFFIGDFFTIKRGERIVKNKDYFNKKTEGYKYRVITSTKQNNGVDGYYHSFNCNENSIVCGGEAGGMYTTYQPEKCWVVDRARIFIPKNNIKLNKFIALYLATIFNQNSYKYSYSRTPNPSKIEQTVIKLPIDKEGNPDWKFVENYMIGIINSSSNMVKNLFFNKEALLESLINGKIPKLDVNSWKNFVYSDIFLKPKRGKLNSIKEYNKGNTPVVSATEYNNGVSNYLYVNNNLIENGNCITIANNGSVGSAFCQGKEFVATSDVSILRLKDNKIQLNKYIGLFLITILSKEKYRFNYGRKLDEGRLQNIKIKLPIDKEGNPNWEFMENYITSNKFII